MLHYETIDARTLDLLKRLLFPLKKIWLLYNSQLKKQSEGLNLHNRMQAKRSFRSAYHIRQRSERANNTRFSLSDCILESINTTDCASLIRGYENVVFQTITSLTNIQLHIEL